MSRKNYNNSYNSSLVNGSPVYVNTVEFNDFTKSGNIYHAQGSHDVAIASKSFYANSAYERREWHGVDNSRARAHETMMDEKNAHPKSIKHIKYLKVGKGRWAVNACVVSGKMVSCSGYTSTPPASARKIVNPRHPH